MSTLSKMKNRPMILIGTFAHLSIYDTQFGVSEKANVLQTVGKFCHLTPKTKGTCPYPVVGLPSLFVAVPTVSTTTCLANHEVSPSSSTNQLSSHGHDCSLKYPPSLSAHQHSPSSSANQLSSHGLHCSLKYPPSLFARLFLRQRVHHTGIRQFTSSSGASGSDTSQKYWEMMYRERMEGKEREDESPVKSSPHDQDATQQVFTHDPPSPHLTHTDASGRAQMVDVGGKPVSVREARAEGRIYLGAQAFHLVRLNKMKKGDVLTVAQLAGIMAAKKTADLIPLCHSIALNKVDVTCSLNEAELSVDIQALVRMTGVTGVEMEALTAVSVAALTVYDMCKAVTREMVISGVRLVLKTGGQRGDYRAD